MIKPQPTFSLAKSKSHKVHKTQQSNPKFKGKWDYLLWFNAQYCTKDEITGLYSITDKHIPPKNKPKQTKIASEKTKTRTKTEMKRAKQQADWSTNWLK